MLCNMELNFNLEIFQDLLGEQPWEIISEIHFICNLPSLIILTATKDLHVLQSACNLNIKMLARAVSHELGVSWV